MTTIAFVTEKAPQGGCALKQIKFDLDAEGKPTVLSLETVAYCSTLVEANTIESRMKADMFNEDALPPPVERVHYLPAPAQQQPQPHQFDVRERLPQVVEDMANPKSAEPDPGLVGRIKSVMPNGRANALVWFVILTAGYMSQRMA